MNPELNVMFGEPLVFEVEPFPPNRSLGLCFIWVFVGALLLTGTLIIPTSCLNGFKGDFVFVLLIDAHYCAPLAWPSGWPFVDLNTSPCCFQQCQLGVSLAAGGGFLLVNAADLGIRTGFDVKRELESISFGH